MANYFLRDDDKQQTPTGTVQPTVSPNTGKTGAAADAKVVSTPAAVNTPQQQTAVSAPAQPVSPSDNTVQQPAQPQGAQNYFAPNTATNDKMQGEQAQGSDEGLNEDEQALMAMNSAVQNNYRKQYKEASDVTQGVFDYLNGGSEKEEEPYRKKNESRKKLYALADAIRQIGNLAYVTKGATPQKFNSPVSEQEAKYQQEKALRDKDRAARADAAQKKAKMDADAAYKDALLQMKGNANNAAIYKDMMKRRADADKFAWTQKKDLANLDLQGRRLNETARHNKAMEGLSARRVAIAASNAATSRMRAVYEIAGKGGFGKGSKTYTTPDGVTYTLSKDFITPANVKTVYDTMVKRGVISKQDQDAVNKDLQNIIGNLGGNKSTGTNSMLSAILSAATGSYKGHETFTYFGNRLGYRYEGGMSDALKRKLIKSGGGKPKPQQKAAPKQAAKPQQKQAAPKKPAASQNGGQKKNKRSQLTI